MKNDSVAIGQPKKKYRIVIQQRNVKHSKQEACRSFMIYDFKGKSTIDKVKEQLKKVEL